MLDVAVSQAMLDRPRILPVIGQLVSRYVQEPFLQIYLIPAQTEQFRYPQAVAIGDQD